MIYDAFILSAWCVVFWAACHALGRSERRALRYRACLRRIARLEKELGIGQNDPPEEWRVESVQFTDVRRNPHAILSNISEG